MVRPRSVRPPDDIALFHLDIVDGGAQLLRRGK